MAKEQTSLECQKKRTNEGKNSQMCCLNNTECSKKINYDMKPKRNVPTKGKLTCSQKTRKIFLSAFFMTHFEK